MIKQIRKLYPQENIAPIDYDPGASEVNQINRLKLMMSTAHERVKKQRIPDLEPETQTQTYKQKVTVN